MWSKGRTRKRRRCTALLSLRGHFGENNRLGIENTGDEKTGGGWERNARAIFMIGRTDARIRDRVTIVVDGRPVAKVARAPVTI